MKIEKSIGNKEINEGWGPELGGTLSRRSRGNPVQGSGGTRVGDALSLTLKKLYANPIGKA